MKNILRTVALILLIPTIVAAILAMTTVTKFDSISGFKLFLVNVYSGTPAAIVRLDLRRALRTRDFEDALKVLKMQKSIAENIGLSNFMKHDLLENTNKAVDLARLTGDEGLFLEWVLELQKIAPLDYLTIALLSRIQTGPQDKVANEAANKAIDTLPVDEAPYRAIIYGKFRFDGGNRIAADCRRYSKAQIGALDPWYSPTARLRGQGIRSMVLAFDGYKSKPSYAISQGMKLGVPARNVFDIDSAEDSTLMRLILPSVPGLMLQIDGLNFRTKTGVQRFHPNQLRIIPTYGYVLSPNQYLITSDFGEAFLIRPDAGTFPRSTQVEFEYTIHRLALANDPNCLPGQR